MLARVLCELDTFELLMAHEQGVQDLLTYWCRSELPDKTTSLVIWAQNLMRGLHRPEPTGPRHIATPPVSPLRYLEVTLVLVDFLQRAEEAETAEQLLGEALRMPGLKMDAMSTVTLLLQEAILLRLQKKFTQALAKCRMALSSLKEDDEQEESPHMIACLTLLGQLCRDSMRFEESAAYLDHAVWLEKTLLYRQLLHEARTRHGDKDTRTARAMINLATARQRLNKMEEARTLLLDANEIYHEALGPDAPDTATWGLYSLGGQYALERRWRDGLTMFERALSVQTKSLGPHHADTLRTIVARDSCRARQLALDRGLRQGAGTTSGVLPPPRILNIASFSNQ